MVNVDGQRVDFVFFRPQARAVDLIGDFNQWRRGELAMNRTANGFWRASVRLPAGVFKFRYMADGQGFPDYAAFGLEPGPFGLNSVIHVDRSEADVAKEDATGVRQGRFPVELISADDLLHVAGQVFLGGSGIDLQGEDKLLEVNDDLVHVEGAGGIEESHVVVAAVQAEGLFRDGFPVDLQVLPDHGHSVGVGAALIDALGVR